MQNFNQKQNLKSKMLIKNNKKQNFNQKQSLSVNILVTVGFNRL